VISVTSVLFSLNFRGNGAPSHTSQPVPVLSQSSPTPNCPTSIRFRAKSGNGFPALERSTCWRAVRTVGLDRRRMEGVDRVFEVSTPANVTGEELPSVRVVLCFVSSDGTAMLGLSSEHVHRSPNYANTYLGSHGQRTYHRLHSITRGDDRMEYFIRAPLLVSIRMLSRVAWTHPTLFTCEPFMYSHRRRERRLSFPAQKIRAAKFEGTILIS